MGIKTAVTIAIGLPFIAAFGAQLGTIVTPIIVILAICAMTILIALNKIRSGHYPFYIFAFTLGLMYSASMVGAHVIGSDMQQEYYVSSQTYLNGWDFVKDYGSQSSTSFVVGWLVPQLSRLSHLDIEWIYKAILPFIFSFTTVVLYYAFNKQIGAKFAYYASLFFMVMPVATLEIVQIGKSMIAELFFALIILLMVAEIKNRYKIPLIVICLTVSILSHYTVGLMAVFYLGFIVAIRFVSLPLKSFSLFKYSRVTLVGLALLLILGIGTTYYYYSKANGGVIMGVVNKLIPGYTGIIASTVSDITDNSNIPQSVNKPNLDGNATPTGKLSYMQEQSPLVKAAIGLDFNQISLAGKIFRIIQFITELLIILGLFYLIFRAKKYRFTTEFVAGIIASFILMFAVIFVPHFSAIINATRFYHMALFFIAPLFVIGGFWVLRKEWAVVAIILVYFLFTSGLVFETTQSNNINELAVPYSVGLSAERTGVVPVYSQDDINAAKWIVDNGNPNYRVVGDYNGYRLMMAYVKINPQLRTSSENETPTLDSLPNQNAYLIVTEWDTQHNKMIGDIRNEWESIGLRQYYDLPEFNYPVVYRSGDAIVYQRSIN